MQRIRRSKAGNIYKKRREEEIQLELTSPKSKKKKPMKVKSRHVGSPTATRTSATSKSNNGFHSDEEEEDGGEFFQPEVILKEEPMSGTDSEGDIELNSKSNHNPSSSTRSSARVQKNLNNRFKCPHCSASFAEQRYVEFHCEQKHKAIAKEEKLMVKQTVREAKQHFKQLTRRRSGSAAEKEEDSDLSDSEPGSPEATFELEDPPNEFLELNPELLEESVLENVEEYYDKVSQDGEMDKYRCKQCGMKLASKHILMIHVQRHLSDNPTGQPCPYCPFRSKTRANLEIHMYTHTGVKPFCCKVCDLSFKCTDELLTHCQESHSQDDIAGIPQNITGERRPRLRFNSNTPPKAIPQHKCPFCTQRFISELNLETHINIHKIKGITEEEREEELRTIEEAARNPPKAELLEETKTIQLPVPSRPKRRVELPLLPRSKRIKKEEEFAQDMPVKDSVVMDGPPRCHICNNIFLYTTSLEKHIREAHGEKSELNEVVATQPEDKTETSGAAAVSQATIISSPENLGGNPTQTKGSPPKALSQAPPSAGSATTTISNGLPLITTKQISTAQGTNKAGVNPQQPMKSVFLLFDPASNTVIPVSPALLGLGGETSSPTASISNSTPSKVGISTIPLSSNSNIIAQPVEDSSAQILEISTTEDDLELSMEWERLVGTPGAPLSAGADNPDLEHECSMCREKIIGYQQIVKHFHTHTAGDTYICHLCDKRFSSKSSLGVHFLIHVGITFSCPLCDRKLAKKQSLLEHIRYHKGERRHCCKECGKTFITGSSLNRHLRMHEAQRPPTTPQPPAKLFTCGYCQRKFPDQVIFANHIKAHKIMSSHSPATTAKADPDVTIPFTCQYCGKMWGSPLGLSRHLKLDHAIGTPLSIANAPPSKFSIQPQTLLVTPISQPIFMNQTTKVIDIIDLSDDEEMQGVDYDTAGIGNSVTIILEGTQTDSGVDLKISPVEEEENEVDELEEDENEGIINVSSSIHTTKAFQPHPHDSLDTCEESKQITVVIGGETTAKLMAVETHENTAKPELAVPPYRLLEFEPADMQSLAPTSPIGESSSLPTSPSMVLDSDSN